MESEGVIIAPVIQVRMIGLLTGVDDLLKNQILAFPLVAENYNITSLEVLNNTFLGEIAPDKEEEKPSDNDTSKNDDNYFHIFLSTKRTSSPVLVASETSLRSVDQAASTGEIPFYLVSNFADGANLNNETNKSPSHNNRSNEAEKKANKRIEGNEVNGLRPRVKVAQIFGMSG